MQNRRVHASARARVAVALATTSALAGAAAVASGPVRAAETAAQPLTLAFVTGEYTDPFFTAMHCGMSAAAKEANVNLIWQGSPQADDASVLKVLDAVMTEKPDGLMFEPFDSAGEISPMENIAKTGVPVVIVDGSLDKNVGIQNPHTDSFAAGKAAGLVMGQSIGAGGVVGIVSDSPANTLQIQRYKGFEEGLKAGDPTVKILPIAYAGTSTSQAATDVAAWAVANPDLKGVFATAGPLGSGAASAVDAAGMKGKILVYSYDTEPYQVSALKAGEEQALVGQSPYTEGYYSTDLLAKVLRHQVKPESLPYDYFTPFKLVTPENVDSPEVQPFLYKGC
jgi:ribose transport system substrate-binding protein